MFSAASAKRSARSRSVSPGCIRVRIISSRLASAIRAVAHADRARHLQDPVLGQAGVVEGLGPPRRLEVGLGEARARRGPDRAGRARREARCRSSRSSAGDLGDFARRVARPVAGDAALDRQQRQPPGADRVAQFLQRHPFRGRAARAASAAARGARRLRARRAAPRPRSRSCDRHATATAGVAAAAQFAAAALAGHGLGAAEEEVDLRPAQDRGSARLDSRQRLLVDPRLGLDDAVLEVKARRLAPPRRPPCPARPPARSSAGSPSGSGSSRRCRGRARSHHRAGPPSAPSSRSPAVPAGSSGSRAG